MLCSVLIITTVRATTSSSTASWPGIQGVAQTLSVVNGKFENTGPANPHSFDLVQVQATAAVTLVDAPGLVSGLHGVNAALRNLHIVVSSAMKII